LPRYFCRLGIPCPRALWINELGKLVLPAHAPVQIRVQEKIRIAHMRLPCPGLL
jgi:hypothetical protein